MANSLSIRVGAPGASKASSEVDQLKGKFAQLQQTAGKFNASGGLAAGVGAAVTLKAFSLAGAAIGDVTGFLGDSVRAYQEEEVAQNRLAESLKANVAGWNGNTNAIEAATQAGIKLGFTDTDTANAMSLLVAATHDQATALKMLGVAQDLARFKNISLNDAATALTSIEAGRSRGLAALGINVKNFATTEERLAAVEKVAGGQAASFADTDLGKLQVATAKTDQAQEKFGKGLSKLEAVILPALADGVGNAASALDDFFTSIDKHSSQLDKIRAAMDSLTNSEWGNTDAGRAQLRAWQDQADAIAAAQARLSAAQAKSQDMETAQYDLAKSVDTSSTAFNHLAHELAGLGSTVQADIEKLDALDTVGNAQKNIDALEAWRKATGDLNAAQQLLYDSLLKSYQAQKLVAGFTTPGTGIISTGIPRATNTKLDVNVHVTASNSVITPGAATAIANAIGPAIMRWAQTHNIVPHQAVL